MRTDVFRWLNWFKAELSPKTVSAGTDIPGGWGRGRGGGGGGGEGDHTYNVIHCHHQNVSS